MGRIDLPREPWSEVVARVEQSRPPIAWCRVQLRREDEWPLALLTVRSGLRVQRRELHYANARIVSESLAPRIAARRLREGFASPKRDRVRFAVPEQNQSAVWWTTEQGYASRRRPEWPQYELEHRLNNSPTVSLNDHEPLLAKGLPFYVSSRAAAAELAFGMTRDELGNDGTWRVLILLPDHRGRLGNVTFVDGATTLSVEANEPDGLKGATLRVSWREESEQVTWLREDIPVRGSQLVTLETSKVPTELSAYLCAGDGTVLDRREWAERYGDRPEAPLALSALVDRWVSEGEHTQLEYKRQLGGDVNRSFAATVGAFANGVGGVVLLGVADDGTVIGYDPRDLRDQVTAIIRDNVDPMPSFQMDRTLLKDRPIWAIRVASGAGHIHLSNGVPMIRTNALTRPARAQELQQMVTPPVSSRPR